MQRLLWGGFCSSVQPIGSLHTHYKQPGYRARLQLPMCCSLGHVRFIPDAGESWNVLLDQEQHG